MPNPFFDRLIITTHKTVYRAYSPGGQKPLPGLQFLKVKETKIPIMCTLLKKGVITHFNKLIYVCFIMKKKASLEKQGLTDKCVLI